MSATPIRARLVKDGPARGRILCGARDATGRYWCRGLIHQARRIDNGTPGGQWEAYQWPKSGLFRRASGRVPEGAVPFAWATPLPFERPCPDHPEHLAIVDMAVLDSP